MLDIELIHFEWMGSMTPIISTYALVSHTERLGNSHLSVQPEPGEHSEHSHCCSRVVVGGGM